THRRALGRGSLIGHDAFGFVEAAHVLLRRAWEFRRLLSNPASIKIAVHFLLLKPREKRIAVLIDINIPAAPDGEIDGIIKFGTETMLLAFVRLEKASASVERRIAWKLVFVRLAIGVAAIAAAMIPHANIDRKSVV